MRHAGRLARIRRLGLREAGFRTASIATRTAQRLMARAVRPRWRRGRLAAVLGTSQAIAPVRQLLLEERWHEAHRAISSYLSARPQRFVIHPSMRADVRRLVLARYPAAAIDAAAHADRIADGSYDLLGYEGLRFSRAQDAEPDWHFDPVAGRRAPLAFFADVRYLDPAYGDHKVIWELNRHQHWMLLGRAWWLTGDHRHRRAFIREAGSWLRHNPPLTGINWASALELALRSISWLWAMELFAADPEPDEAPWLVDLLLGLDRQLRHVEGNLSRYFSPNTHLLGEGLALYVCGRTWPELRRAATWARVGSGILTAEATRQVLPDGMHAERSTHYHRYALDFYLLAVTTARLSGDDAHAATWGETAERMAVALRQLADASGRAPLIGDDDGGELCPIAGRAPDSARSTLGWAAVLLGRSDVALAPVPEAVVWLVPPAASIPAAPAEREPLARSVHLEHGGYCVSRRGDSLLVLDAGPHGFMNGGHAHADALAVTLTARGHRLLVDPGTGTYTMDPTMRDRFRSSRLHNTLTIDNRSQATPGGPFHWSSMASGRARLVVLAPAFDYVEAVTDAYAPLVHERLIFAPDEDQWIIADRVLGSGRHEATLHWHLDPAWTAEPDGRGGVALTHATGLRARMAVLSAALELLRGDAVSGLGWVAPVYGRIVPSTTIRCTIDRAAPFAVITTIGAGDCCADAGSMPVDVLSTDRPGLAIGVMTRHGATCDVTMFRGPEQDAATLDIDPRHGRALTTDARALHVRVAPGGRLQRVAMVHGSIVRFEGAAAVTITASEPVTDLDVDLAQPDRPVVSSTRPPARLSIAGDGLDATMAPLTRATVGGASAAAPVRA